MSNATIERIDNDLVKYTEPGRTDGPQVDDWELLETEGAIEGVAHAIPVHDESGELLRVDVYDGTEHHLDMADPDLDRDVDLFGPLDPAHTLGALAAGGTLSKNRDADLMHARGRTHDSNSKPVEKK